MHRLKMLPLIVLLLLSTGCVGYWKSENSPIQTKELSGGELSYFGVERARENHPINGSQIYNEKISWCGLTILAVIPIPLMLPTCRSFTELTFKDNVPIRTSTQFVKTTGAFCGPFVPFLNMWAGSFSPCAVHNPHPN
ncbi:hypothetical protein [Pseudomonas sp.]|uniref:hypothetical protein n=1 Tax=Pseudomonas sp. TaxID=306 RepID=UPI003BB726A6